MASDELRKRLEALNGRPLARPLSDRAKPERTSRETRRGSPRALSTDPGSAQDRKILAESLAVHVGGEPRPLADGREYHHVEMCLVESGCLDAERCADATRVLESASFRDHLRRPITARPSDALFLDLETLGLHGEPLFLIGLLTLSPEGVATCTQLLARGVDEEAALLDRCTAYLRASKLLVTFNGKSFDVPFLKARYERHGLRSPRVPTHVDLLVEARIRYRGQFKDCRLQTLEQHLCGRARTGDIPGSQIPGVYRACVASGDATPLASILLHNRLDLATTAELLARFWS